MFITFVTKCYYFSDLYYEYLPMTPEAHLLESTATFYAGWGTASPVLKSTEDWCQARLFNVGAVFQHRYRLVMRRQRTNHVASDGSSSQRLKIWTSLTIYSTGLTHPSAHARQDVPSCTFAQQVGLKISHKKKEVMMLNVQHPAPVKVNGEDIPTTEEFTYLASIVRNDGRTGNDIRNRLSKARNAFRMMNNVWRPSQYSTKTKLRLYQSCVLSTLLCGSECWRMTECDVNKLATFNTKNLRRIPRIFWLETISNQQLVARCNQESMETIILRR